MFNPDYDPMTLLEQCCQELERLSRLLESTSKLNAEMVKAINNGQGHIIEQSRRLTDLETRIALLEIK